MINNLINDWVTLSMRQRAAYIKDAVSRGIYNIDNIRKDYYANGGHIYKGGGWFNQHKSRWYEFLVKQGVSASDADRLAGFFTALDGLESAGGTSNAATKHNNYGGMQKNGKNIHYDSVNDYMRAKWGMMNTRFAPALLAKSIEEYGTILGNPSTAGKGYLYYVADGYNSKDPRNPQWVARQNAHMNNYIAGMLRYYGSRNLWKLAPIPAIEELIEELPVTTEIVNPVNSELILQDIANQIPKPIMVNDEEAPKVIVQEQENPEPRQPSMVLKLLSDAYNTTPAYTNTDLTYIRPITTTERTKQLQDKIAQTGHETLLLNDLENQIVLEDRRKLLGFSLGGNLYPIGGGLITSLSPMIDHRPVMKSAGRAAKRRIYRTVTPLNYDLGKALKLFIIGKTRDMSATTPAGNEEWARYLGVPYDLPSNFEPATYTPAVGKATYDTVLKFKDESLILSDDVLRQLIKNQLKTGKNTMLIEGNGAGLGSYTVSMGKDDNGNYISYYDDWDINPFKGINSGVDIPIISNIENIVPGTHPFTVYGRRYYTDEDLQRINDKGNGGSITNLFLNGGLEINWPALGNVNFGVYPDSTFVLDPVGDRGYISTITPNLVKALWGDEVTEYEANRIPYPGARGIYINELNHLVNPVFGENSIIYNPNYINRDALSLDALHVMHDDSIYESLYNDYMQAAINNNNVYKAAYDEFGDEGARVLNKYYKNEKLTKDEKEMIAPIFDGFLRRLLAPSYMLGIKGGYEAPVNLENTVLGNKIQGIRDYLESYPLQEVVVTGKKKSLGGNLYPIGGYIDYPANNAISSTTEQYYDPKYLKNVETVLSYTPIIGTMMDWGEFIKNPSLENLGWAAFSTFGDALGASMLKRTKAATKEFKAAKQAEKAAEEALATHRKATRNIIAESISREDRKLVEQLYDARVNASLKDPFWTKVLEYPVYGGWVLENAGINAWQNSSKALGGHLYSGEEEPTQQMNIMAYNPKSDTWSSPETTLEEIVVTGDKSKVKPRLKPLYPVRYKFKGFDNWTSPKGAGNMSLTAAEAAEAQDAMFPYFSSLVPNVFRGIDDIQKGDYLGVGLEAAKAVGARYLPEVINGTVAVGDALAATGAGQRLTSGLNFVADAVGSSKMWPWMNAGLTSAFGAHSIDKAASGDVHSLGDVVDVGLGLLPMAQVAKSAVNTAGRIGSIIESRLPEIRKALTLNPLPSYKYEDIIKSNFYRNLVSDYGETEASYIAREISSPEGREFIMGSSPRTAYKEGKRHLTQMNLIRDLEDAGAVLGGSPKLAQAGYVDREGLLHDIDVFAPGSMEELMSPLFANSSLGLTPLYKQQTNPFAATGMVPRSRKVTIGSPSEGYINIPHTRDGEVVDMFIRPDFPTTDEQAVNMILNAKRQFGRPKDIEDLVSFKPYSADNPMINLATGEGQWNPTLFNEGIFTEEGYPFIQLVETYPGSGVKVPAMMNYRGQIRGFIDNTGTPSGLLSEEPLVARGIPTEMDGPNDWVLKGTTKRSGKLLEDAVLRFIGEHPGYRISTGTPMSREGLNLAEIDLLNVFERRGLDTSRFTPEDLNEALNLRRIELRRSLPNDSRYNYVETNNLGFNIADVKGYDTAGNTMILSNPDNRLHIEMVQNLDPSVYSGVSQRAYDAAIRLAQATNREGLVSGERLLMPEVTTNVYRHYPNKLKIGDYGLWGPEDATAVGGNPVYLLSEPSKLRRVKSDIFDPIIIGNNGDMNIFWDKSNLMWGNGGHLRKSSKYHI